MNQQTRLKRRAYLHDRLSLPHDVVEDLANGLDALERESENPFYDAVRRLDANVKMFYAAQGDERAQRAVIDAIIAHLSTYAESLKEVTHG